MKDEDFKVKIKIFSNEELLEQMDFMTEGYYSNLMEVCLEEIRCRLDATKWYYPSKGELPKENGKYFCCHKYNDNLIPTIGIYNIHNKLWCGESGIAWNRDPIAWQYFIPPKDIENERG